MEHDDTRADIALAMVGNHLPRRCGIATFTSDLSSALAAEFPEIECFVLAMNDGGRRHAYPECVRFELAESDVASYRRAADFLNVNAVDVVSLQHEYGIFGGRAGSHVLALVRELRMPVVTTLHTVLPEPGPHHRDVMNELIELSERIVVMSSRGAELLSAVHQVSREKVEVIAHGIPQAPTARGSKHRLGVDGRPMILTFGLLSPDKGIEHVIDALPLIAERFPEVLYIVLGATHPHVKERHGESYRLSLEQRAERLGVEGNLIFHDRFVSQSEIVEFLAAADIYVTPYLKAEQVTSGTLAYAVGAGKAVISTPYSYARELLADGRGVLVPWRDAGAIAREAIAILGDDVKRREMGARAAAFANDMAWPAVARRYHTCFARARSEHASRRRAVYQGKTLAKRPAELPETNLEHVGSMTDSTGMLQHAVFSVARYEDGYCLDDNARALLLMTLLQDAGTEDGRTVKALAARYLAFVFHAFDDRSGRFRNFMSYNRDWSESVGSEDSHGRAVWALGAAVGRCQDPGKESLAGVLFRRALPAIEAFTTPRAWAFALLGIAEYLRAFQGDSSVQSTHRLLAERLFEMFGRSASAEWPWFEDRVTYENARLSQTLIASGVRLDQQEMTRAGLRSLEWLISLQLSDGHFAPVGCNGFYARGQSKAEFDQQPIDAWATVSACLEARRATGDERWLQHARRAFGWFLGQNHLQQSLYDASTGGCRDGLHVERVNENQGSESTLAFQLALLEMREVEPARAVRLVSAAPH